MLFLSRALFILIIISISEKRPPSAFNVIDRLNKLVVYLYKVAFGESNENINVTFQVQFIGQNQGQAQNVRFLAIVAVFFCRTNVTEITKYCMYIS